VPTAAIGQDAFQECDTVGITRPCVKHNFLVKNVADLATTVKKAFYLASTGRPGPVVVDIPKDVTQSTAEFAYPKTVSMRSYNPVTRGHAGQIKKAVQLLLEAKRPMVYTGGGVILNNASEALTRLVRLLGFPCTNTLMGLGGIPGTDPQFTGLPGMQRFQHRRFTIAVDSVCQLRLFIQQLSDTLQPSRPYTLKKFGRRHQLPVQSRFSTVSTLVTADPMSH
jgi:acetolactate synthase-1/2/3 large subunit